MRVHLEKPQMMIDGLQVSVKGSFKKLARLRDEYYEYVAQPEEFVTQLRAAKTGADLFTFLQETAERVPRFGFHREAEQISVIPVSNYDHWWKKQLNDKTRNMIRKSQKAGLEVRVAEFNDEFVRGIVGIYDESPMRQGKPFAHYQKPFETVREDNASYRQISDYIGAYFNGELVGFAKLVHRGQVSSLMQIIAKVAHRDKAPTNALIAKAVELCAARGVAFLHYGLWSKRGLGDFKKKCGFEPFEVHRYFVPVSMKGRALLALRLHRRLPEYVPEKWHDGLVDLRTRITEMRLRSKKA
jgi:hypothetical protein